MKPKINEFHIRFDSNGRWYCKETNHEKEANRVCQIIFIAVTLGYLAGLGMAMYVFPFLHRLGV